MQSTTTTRPIPVRVGPDFTLSPAELMLELGITAEDMADQALSLDTLVEANREARDAEATNPPNFRQAHPERAAAWLKSNQGFRVACATEGMVMESGVRIPAMAAILGVPGLRSSKQATPEQLDRLAGMVSRGELYSDWTLAPVEDAEPVKLSEDDFEAILKG